MKIVETLSALALRQLLDGRGSEEAAAAVNRCIADHGERMSTALRRANERSWKALELTLAGDPWWNASRSNLASDEQPLADKLQSFISSLPAADALPESDRAQCLVEVRRARNDGHIASSPPQGSVLSLPVQMNDGQDLMARAAGELAQAGFDHLARFLTQQRTTGQPLLADAVRYFFHKEVEGDPELTQVVKLETPLPAFAVRFDVLADLLDNHEARLEALLAPPQVQSNAEQAPRPPLDPASEADQLLEPIRAIARQTHGLLSRYRMQNRLLRPSDTMVIQDEKDRAEAQQALTSFSALTEDQQRLPALLQEVGKLAVGIGTLDAARNWFTRLASATADPAVQAAAHYQAYLVALEMHDWMGALPLLLQAAALAPERFEPLPLAKYEPERIIRAGGAGTAILCKNRVTESRVLIQTLWPDSLDRDASEVFREARGLEDLPAISRLRDCDFAGPDRTLPYLVTDYFEGLSLADYVRQQGLLPPGDLARIAGPVAEALLHAHERGTWHRDIKPANILLRNDGTGWKVKIIDFGLSLDPGLVHRTLIGGAAWTRTATGASAAGTLAFAAPEQLGWLPGATVGAHSDVYAFGKVCYLALLGTPEPDDDEKEVIPVGLRKLLGACTARNVRRRLPGFQVVLERFSQLISSSAPANVSVRSVAPSVPRVVATQSAPPPTPTGAAASPANVVQGWLNRGMAFRQQGDMQKAILAFTKALEIDPKLTAAYVKRGNALGEIGQLDKAIADYSAAINIDPGQAIFYMNRGLAHAKKGDYEKVIADCSEAIRLDSKLAGAYFIRGVAFLNRNERHRAIAEFTLTLRLEPKNALAFNERGMAFAEEGEYDRAIKDYTEATKIDSRLTVAYVNRGIAYRMKSEYERATNEFTKALHLEPNHVAAHFNRALCSIGRKAFEQAIAELDRVLQLDPRHPEAAARREEAVQLRDKSRQVKVEQRRTQLATNEQEEKKQVRVAAYFTRGVSLLEQGNYPEAIQQFTKALEIDPRDATAYHQRGLAYVEEADYELAIADFNQAIKINPKNAETYCQRAVAFQLRGDLNHSITDCTQAIKLNPNSTLAFRTRSEAYAAKGDVQRSQADFEEARKLEAKGLK